MVNTFSFEIFYFLQLKHLKAKLYEDKLDFTEKVRIMIEEK